SDDLLHLADFLSNFPADLFALAFGLQVGIVRGSSNFLFNAAFHFVQPSIRFVLDALLHGLFPPFGRLPEFPRPALGRPRTSKQLRLISDCPRRSIPAGINATRRAGTTPLQ